MVVHGIIMVWYIRMHSVAFNLKAVAKASACVHNVLCACVFL